MLLNSIAIIKAETVVEETKKKADIEVTIEQVRTIMKDELGLGYRMARKIPVQANHKRCLVLRQ